MSAQTAVTLREVQEIYQGLVPWAVKGNHGPLLIKQDVLARQQGRPFSNDCVLGLKDNVHTRLDNRTLRIGFVVQSKIL